MPIGPITELQWLELLLSLAQLLQRAVNKQDAPLVVTHMTELYDLLNNTAVTGHHPLFAQARDLAIIIYGKYNQVPRGTLAYDAVDIIAARQLEELLRQLP